jgi:excisionase family DNA binding protein
VPPGVAQRLEHRPVVLLGRRGVLGRGRRRRRHKRAVAAQLRVSVRTVERLQAAGELPPVRLGLRTVRYHPADVAALIERRRGA